jgi:hypothetical protein
MPGVVWGLFLMHLFVLLMTLENNVTYGGAIFPIYYALFNLCMCLVGVHINRPRKTEDDMEEE